MVFQLILCQDFRTVCQGRITKKRARTAGGIPASLTAHDMDKRFYPYPAKWTVNCIPADEFGRDFLLPLRAGYDILERALCDRRYPR